MRCSGTSTLVLPTLGHKGSTPICNFPTSHRKAFETLTNIPCAWSTNSNFHWSLDTKHSQDIKLQSITVLFTGGRKTTQAILCILSKSMLVLTTPL